MRLIGYIHKKDLEEVQPENEARSNPKGAEMNFYISRRGIMVWDKKWEDGNDVEVILEINLQKKNNWEKGLVRICQANQLAPIYPTKKKITKAENELLSFIKSQKELSYKEGVEKGRLLANSIRIDKLTEKINVQKILKNIQDNNLKKDLTISKK